MNRCPRVAPTQPPALGVPSRSVTCRVSHVTLSQGRSAFEGWLLPTALLVAEDCARVCEGHTDVFFHDCADACRGLREAATAVADADAGPNN